MGSVRSESPVVTAALWWMCSLCLCVLKEEGGGGGDEGFFPQQLESIFLTPSSTSASPFLPPTLPSLGCCKVLTRQGFVSVPFLKKKKKGGWGVGVRYRVQSLSPKFSQGLSLQLCQQCQVSKIKRAQVQTTKQSQKCCLCLQQKGAEAVTKEVG